MRTNFRRRYRAAVLLALGMVMGAPALVHAQLFPNLPIRRQRIPCAQEDPAYRTIREQYYGYYPTCWRRFPPYWGCVSPEKPDWTAEKARNKLQTEAIGGGAATGEESPTQPGGVPPARMPDLPPEGVSPFDIPARPGTGGNRPPGDAAPAPAPTPAPAPERKPNTAPEPKPVGDNPPRANPPTGSDLADPPPLAPPGADVPSGDPEARPAAGETSAFAPRRGLLSGLFTRNRRR